VSWGRSSTYSPASAGRGGAPPPLRLRGGRRTACLPLRTPAGAFHRRPARRRARAQAHARSQTPQPSSCHGGAGDPSCLALASLMPLPLRTPQRSRCATTGIPLVRAFTPCWCLIRAMKQLDSVHACTATVRFEHGCNRIHCVAASRRSMRGGADWCSDAGSAEAGMVSLRRPRVFFSSTCVNPAWSQRCSTSPVRVLGGSPVTCVARVAVQVGLAAARLPYPRHGSPVLTSSSRRGRGAAVGRLGDSITTNPRPRPAEVVVRIARR